MFLTNGPCTAATGSELMMLQLETTSSARMLLGLSGLDEYLRAWGFAGLNPTTEP